MPSSPNPKLDAIRIQTARMLEIYSLLRRQLDEGDVHLPREKYDQLSAAIRTIARNMLELQSHHTQAQEEQTSTPTAREEVPSSRPRAPQPPRSLQARASDASLTRLGATASEPLPVSASELRELDEIVDQVLRWHMANGDMV